MALLGNRYRAHIRGSSGLGGGLMSSSAHPHDMAELERVVLSAIADFVAQYVCIAQSQMSVSDPLRG
jgi:hypothetical protein